MKNSARGLEEIQKQLKPIGFVIFLLEVKLFRFNKLIKMFHAVRQRRNLIKDAKQLESFIKNKKFSSKSWSFWLSYPLGQSRITSLECERLL